MNKLKIKFLMVFFFFKKKTIFNILFLKSHKKRWVLKIFKLFKIDNFNNIHLNLSYDNKKKSYNSRLFELKR